MIYIITACLTAYLLGSINFAVIFTKAFSNTDVRDYYSGNAGTTNVLRVSGKKAGILTFLCDIAKGALACALGLFLFSKANGALTPLYGKYICGIFCMLGHAYPVFFGFKGGKCAATSVGIFAVCCPWAIVLGLVFYAVSMLAFRIVSVSTLVATVVTVTVSCIINKNTAVTVLSVIAGLIVFLRHKENIKRLIKGKEKKLVIKK